MSLPTLDGLFGVVAAPDAWPHLSCAVSPRRRGGFGASGSTSLAPVEGLTALCQLSQCARTPPRLRCQLNSRRPLCNSLPRSALLCADHSHLALTAPKTRFITDRCRQPKQSDAPSEVFLLPRPVRCAFLSVVSVHSLESLTLDRLRVNPDPCGLAALPSLTSLSLLTCGPGAAAAALRMAEGAPRLRALTVSNVPLTRISDRLVLGAGIAGLLPEYARPASLRAAGGAAAGADVAEEEEEEMGDDPGSSDAIAAASGAASRSPYPSLEELRITYASANADTGAVDSDTGNAAPAQPDAPGRVAAVVRALARSGCCPKLKSLAVHLMPGAGARPGAAAAPGGSAAAGAGNAAAADAPPPVPFNTFPPGDPFLLDAAHPFPCLESLSLECDVKSAEAALLELARAPPHSPAPGLKSVALLPWILPGGVVCKETVTRFYSSTAAPPPPKLREAYGAAKARCTGLPALGAKGKEVMHGAQQEKEDGGDGEGAAAEGGEGEAEEMDL